MPIETWSESVVVVHLADDPQFSDDLASLEQQKSQLGHVILDFSAVHFINSSNISRLLKLRKQMQSNGRRLVLCGVNTQVWGVLLITGLDKVFEFVDSVPIALAAVQLA